MFEIPTLDRMAMEIDREIKSLGRKKLKRIAVAVTERQHEIHSSLPEESIKRIQMRLYALIQWEHDRVTRLTRIQDSV
jgi:hypothetical protein